MRVGIISDTHDHMPNIRKAVDILKAEQVDAVIHGGDFIAPFSLIPFTDFDVPIHAVFGNNDGERKGLQAKAKEIGFEIQDRFYRFEIDGVKFMVDHYPISREEALERFKDCDVIVTGHTHEAVIEKIEPAGILMINPGEACGYLEGKALMGILDLEAMDYRTVEIK